MGKKGNKQTAAGAQFLEVLVPRLLDWARTAVTVAHAS